MSSSDPFKRTEDQYFVLRGQLAAGRITREQFDAALKGLMLQDAQGRYWMLGADTGKWFMHDGQAWVEANPAGVQTLSPPPPPPPPPSDLSPTTGGERREPPPSPPPPPARVQYVQTQAPAPAARQGGGGGGCLRACACGCVVLLVLFVAVGVGGYLVVQSGVITQTTVQTTVLNLVGFGPGDIEVDNFRDDAIQVTFQQVDESQGSSTSIGDYKLNAFDVQSFRAPYAGKYRVRFRTQRAATELGTCNLNIKSGDRYQFVTLPDKIVVNRVNNLATVGRDLVVSTSSLCR